MPRFKKDGELRSGIAEFLTRAFLLRDREHGVTFVAARDFAQSKADEELLFGVFNQLDGPFEDRAAEEVVARALAHCETGPHDAGFALGFVCTWNER